jgi:hypothetical protein
VLALSVVKPAGQRIAHGQKTIEVRRWVPNLATDQDLMIVENERYLLREGDENPGGRVVAIVRVGAVRPWTMVDLEASCAASFERGWLAWELHSVRPVTSTTPVLAARRLYELALPADARIKAPLASSRIVLGAAAGREPASILSPRSSANPPAS